MPEYFGIPSDTARKEIELSLTVSERNWRIRNIYKKSKEKRHG
jgi:hypothetical protein